MISDLPTEEGYYYWTNFGEHTPTVMHVREYDGELYATDGEYDFKIEPPEPQLELKLDDDDFEEDDYTVIGDCKYSPNDELWGKIPMPMINGQIFKPSCF